MIRSLLFKLSDFYAKFKIRRVIGNRFLYGKSVRFKKLPIVKIIKGTHLVLGENVKLNSDKVAYHLNMHSPCKIMMDKTGAKISIGNNTRIHGTCLHAQHLIEIGRNCLIAANTQIMDCNGHDLSFEDIDNRINTKGKISAVTIEDSVWIGTGVIILPGVRIGAGSVISANSVVSKSIPSMCLAGGNPAKVIKQY